MRLADRLEGQGAVLFRWRSFVPLLLVPPVLLALPNAVVFNGWIGAASEGVLAAGCVAVSFAGLAIRWLTVGFVPAGTSGRNTHDQRATVLNTTGMYAMLRNPLYLGNFFALLGILLMLKTWWLVALFALAYWLYIERVVAAEEAYLSSKFGAPYADWVQRTPAFLPRFGQWRRPALGFSLRTVLRREYNGVLAVAAAFVLEEFLTDVVGGGSSIAHWARTDAGWLVLLVVALAVFIVLRTLKKHTHLLDVAGR